MLSILYAGITPYVMTSYVDVDTSEEALKEDEELQAAVELIVAKASNVIIEDVKNDVSGVYEQFKAIILSVFPFIVTWSEDRERFYTDMGHLSVAAVLFVVFFWVLTPWGDSSSSSRKSRSVTRGKRESIKRSKSLSSMRRIRDHIRRKPDSLMSRQISGTGDEAEEELIRLQLQHEQEESEVQKFAKRWPLILQYSQYKCLVLPPGCKRVEKPKGRRKPEKKTQSHDKSIAEFTDENPADRLIRYMQQLFHLFVLFRRYDYAGAGRTLITWAQSAMQARNSNNNEQTGMETDDEDEDDSVAGDLMLSSSNTSATGEAIEYDDSEIFRSKRSRRLSRSKKMKSRNLVDDSSNILNGDNHIEYPADENDARETVSTVSQDISSSSQDEDLKLENLPQVAGTGVTDDAVADKTLLKTPPRHSSGSGNEQFFSPLIDNGSTTGTPSRAISPYSESSPIPPSIDTVRKNLMPSTLTIKSRTLATGIKSRDALANYRIETSRKSFENTSRSSLETPSFNRGLEMQGDSTKTFYFETADNVESIRRMAVEVPLPDNNGYILGDEFLPDKSFTPLLVFVNSRSGGQQGHLLTTQLRGLLNPVQIWDLADGAPEEILESFSTFSRLRILVCGGDGTVSWIVSTIESMKLQRWPPIAILPLGTGNDLARIHGWGGGYSNESLIKILEQVSEGYISWLDRWEMTKENKKGKVRNVQSFLNYLSVGADAAAALQVHMLRETRPQLFFSRIVNKLWYGLFGAEDVIKASSMNLRHDITLIADGVEVPLPADSQGIIMLNIDSYTGGVPLWATGETALDSERIEETDSYDSEFGQRTLKRRSKSFDDIKSAKVSAVPKSPGGPAQNGIQALYRADSVEDITKLALTDDEKFSRVTSCDRPSSCQDGLLDIVSVRGTFHLGQIRVGLSNAQKLCQCREATIIIKRKVSVQIDGEPWRQNVCTLRIRRKKNAAIMLHRSANDSNGIETEMANLLDWAKTRQLIDGKVHETMMKEFSKRIESKTRQRRVRSNDNLMKTLIRGINSNSTANASMMGGVNGTGISF